jgi:peptide chain release factor 1
MAEGGGACALVAAGELRWRASRAAPGGQLGLGQLALGRHPVRSGAVLERLAGLADEYRLVVAQLSDPDVISDQRKLRDVARRNHELEPVVAAYEEYRVAVGDVEAAREMLADAEGDEQREMRQEIEEGEARQRVLEEQLKVLLLPRDPNDGKNVILEIRGAEGGEEANLFARDLHDMYSRYVEHLGLRAEIMEADASEMGGFNQVTTLVKGPVAWSHLKYEGGPHRVQRVPVTESQGRIHTSSATVTVLPEAEEADVHIEEKDLKVDVYRSSGPGGQSVNTTDSAVRITHLPTGTVVSMQDEKSQIQNRAKAMVVLRSRLLKAEQDRQAAELSDARRSQVGGGGRSEKIRTYNFKENRVTDHRIGLTIYKLDKVLMGDLDDVVDALIADERARQLAGGDGPS